jgi:hypothetical protein
LVTHVMRFTLTPHLRAALTAVRPHADATEADALAHAEREGTIELSDVQTVSRLLRAHGGEEAAAGEEQRRPPSPVWVHELLLGATPVLPAKAERTPAHPALAPRLEVLRAAQEDREYARMVGSAARSADDAARDVAEMATYRSQMGVGLNLLVSMVTMFTVGAYAGGTAEEPFGVRAVICGLALMLLAMGIEMTLFLIGAVRIDEKVHKRERLAKAKGVMDRTQIGKTVAAAAAASSKTK